MQITLLIALCLCLISPATAEAEGRLIVKYRAHTSAHKRRLSIESVGGAIIGAVRGQGTKLVAVYGDPFAAAARLARRPGVLWAEPDYTLTASAVPDDPLLSQLGGL